MEPISPTRGPRNTRWRSATVSASATTSSVTPAATDRSRVRLPVGPVITAASRRERPSLHQTSSSDLNA